MLVDARTEERKAKTKSKAKRMVLEEYYVPDIPTDTHEEIKDSITLEIGPLTTEAIRFNLNSLRDIVDK